MRCKTVRLGFKRRSLVLQCTGARACRGGRWRAARVGRATRVVLSGSTPLHCRQLSPRVPLCRLNYRCRHRVVLYPEFGPTPRRPLARRRLLPSLCAFFVHPYQSRVSSSSFLQSHLPFLSLYLTYSLLFASLPRRFHLSCPRSVDSAGI